MAIRTAIVPTQQQEITATVAQITNATAANQSLTIPWVLPEQVFIVTAPSLAATGIVISQAYCAVAGTLLVTLANITAAPVTPGATLFKVVAI